MSLVACRQGIVRLGKHYCLTSSHLLELLTTQNLDQQQAISFKTSTMAAAVSTAMSPSISVSSPPRTRVRGTTIVGTLPGSSSSPGSSPQGLRVQTGGLGEAPSFNRSKSVDALGGIIGSSQASASGTSFANSMNMAASSKRPRSSSILSMHEIKENADDDLDKSAFANLNADWVNYKGGRHILNRFQ